MTDNDKTAQNFIETNLAGNLKYLMLTTGIKSVELAEIVGVSAESISKLKNGGFHNPSLRVIAGISTYFKVSLDELIYGDLETKLNNSIDIKSANYVPIIDWEKIKEWNKEPTSSSLILENINTKNVFALYMEHAYGVFLENSFIIIDVVLKPKNNDYVLVLNKNNDIFNIKKLIVEDDSYLQSVMSEVNTIVKHEPDENMIFGVIIGYQKTKFFRYN